MRKTIYVLIVFAVMICSGLSVQAERPAGELRVGLPTLYDQTFHPIWGTLYRRQYLEPMYDYIIGVNEKGDFDPTQGIAYKWEISLDLMTWTFYIRDGIKFHNGDSLTNEDVKYTIEQAASMKNAAGSKSTCMARIRQVKVVRPNKVLVELKKPWPTILYTLSSLGGAEGLVQPKTYIEEKGEEYFMAHPVGSGPYRFHEWKEGVHIKLIAQDSHWRIGVPKYKYLTFKLVPEEGVRDADLRSNKVDVISVGLARSKPLTKDGFRLQRKKDGLFVGLMYLQSWKPDFPTNNKKVRQALTYAIDKEAIVKHILMGNGRVVGTATSMFTWAIEYKSYPHTPYEPQKAKQLLAEAGYPDGFTMYQYSFITKLPETKLINEAIASYWEAIGVKVKLLEMDFTAFKAIWMQKQQPKGTSAFILAWPNRPAYSYRAMYHSTGAYSHYRDAKIDKLIDGFNSQKTKEGYIKAGRGILEHVLDNYYATGICTTDELFAVSKDIPKWNMGKGVGSYRWEYIK